MPLHPRLWLLAQLALGGTYDKRRLVLKHYTNQRRVLEIGCAVGNVSMAFRRFNEVIFVGVDVDSHAIACARSIFKNDPRFRFIAGTAQSLIGREEPFDLVLLAGVLHHVDNDTAAGLIGAAAQLLSSAGTLVISEPEPARASDSWLVRLYSRIERGLWLRGRDELIALAQRSGQALTVSESEETFISPFIFRWPNCVRFAVLKLRPTTSLT
ncbi:MAG: hypothetical protein C5B46_04575 [Proteobacteria bacterium]|nr:MAG: hypothetical protein C5B46_04575 [Pseudomonadota bacterium]